MPKPYGLSSHYHTPLSEVQRQEALDTRMVVCGGREFFLHPHCSCLCHSHIYLHGSLTPGTRHRVLHILCFFQGNQRGDNAPFWRKQQCVSQEKWYSGTEMGEVFLPRTPQRDLAKSSSLQELSTLEGLRALNRCPLKVASLLWGQKPELLTPTSQENSPGKCYLLASVQPAGTGGGGGGRSREWEENDSLL